MAQVIEIMTNSGAEMMLRGKLGNQVFQVRNGKQIVTRIPRRRTLRSGSDLRKYKPYWRR